MNHNEIIIVEEDAPIIRKRGRPLGSRSATSIEEHKQREIQRKKNMQVNFQRYKNLHHDELKKVYNVHYQNNRDKKINRIKFLYHCKKHISLLMAIDDAILA